ncbi:hypothetical protein QNH46_03010 [Paenibacillus woosongensis]|uniref:Uncharacterized protein n=1 Tax=Paenibacillus woosongensis TaxID=307580 RepID=A0AA95I567_9BACL|nr:hypothetical protein [Paenibacillus woosongensis]WHX49671.1 hypothetical protein QNH46_03010 [Paenibacillus woosongensis]
MNYLDEQILRMKQELIHKHDEAKTSQSQLTDSEKESLVSDKNMVLRIKDEVITFAPVIVLDGKIEVKIPKSFHLMPLEQAKFKYPSEHRPKVIYTSSEGTINMTFNPTDTALELEELPDFMERMADVLRSVQPIRNWMGTELIVNPSGLSMGCIRFVTAGVDGNLYNEMLLFILEGYVIIGAFNCLESDRDAWLPVAKVIVQSLRGVSDSSELLYEEGDASR